jgi:hypothetical protein
MINSNALVNDSKHQTKNNYENTAISKVLLAVRQAAGQQKAPLVCGAGEDLVPGVNIDE